jgi:predicted nucleic acid-binding protein
VKRAVLDSFAILVFLFRERGYQKVLEVLERSARANDTLLVAAPNWAEVRYVVERKVGATRWGEVRDKLLGLPLEVVPADRDLAEVAGQIKVARKMSIADCFAAALAQQTRTEIYTGDPEFREVERDIRVVWL